MPENAGAGENKELDEVLAGLEEIFSSGLVSAPETAGKLPKTETSAPPTTLPPSPASPEIMLTFPEESKASSSPVTPEPLIKKEVPAATVSVPESPASKVPTLEELNLQVKAEPPVPTSSQPPSPAENVPAPAPHRAEPPASSTPMPSPVPATAPSATKEDKVPANAPKGQIRRVAFFCAAGHETQRETLAAFLESAALTIAKKPLYLRKVLSESLSSGFEAQAAADKMREVSAAAAIVLLEGLSDDQLSRLDQAVSNAGALFVSVSTADIRKRSMAMDLIMDLMLVPAES